MLGVSTKRLHSIINSTRCPTDTESSDDSDTPKIVEDHISLSEISSEDNFSEGVNRRKKKIKKEKEKGKCCDDLKIKELVPIETTLEFEVLNLWNLCSSVGHNKLHFFQATRGVREKQLLVVVNI